MEEEFLNDDLINRFEEALENKAFQYFDTEEFYEIIAYYLDVGDVDYAEKAIAAAKELHPDSIDIKIKELELNLAQNHLRTAAEMIEQLNDLGTNDSDFSVCKARYWSLKGLPKKAIEFYLKALELGDDPDFIHNCIGNEYLELNEIGQALLHFKQALEHNIYDEYALLSCVQCFEEMHLHKECVDFLNQFIDLNPYSTNGWFQLGLQYITLKKYENALQAFDYVVVIDAESVTGYMQKAYCLELMADYQGAVLEYQEILEIEDSQGFTHFKIGQCYEKLEKPFKALKSYHQALHNDPQLDKAWAATSDLYEKMGNYKEGLYYANRALALDSTNTNYLKRSAYLYIQLGLFEEATKIYENLINLESSHFFNWLGYSELLITIGEYSRAVDVLQRSFKHFKRAELYYQLSNCYFLLGQEEKGLEALTTAQSLNPNLRSQMVQKYPILKQKTVKKITKRPE